MSVFIRGSCLNANRNVKQTKQEKQQQQRKEKVTYSLSSFASCFLFAYLLIMNLFYFKFTCKHVSQHLKIYSIIYEKD